MSSDSDDELLFGAGNNNNGNNNKNDDNGSDKDNASSSDSDDDVPLVKKFEEKKAADKKADAKKAKEEAAAAKKKEKLDAAAATADKFQFPIKSKDDSMEIIKYSDKCVVVRGTAASPAATRHHTAKFKELTGKFNGKLSDPVSKANFAGWIFTTANLPTVAAWIATAESPKEDDDKKDNNNDKKKDAADGAPPAEGMGRRLAVSKDGKIEVIRYSEKAIAIRGTAVEPSATKAHKDKLSDIGKFNGKLTDPVSKSSFAGYIMSFKQLDRAKEFVEKLGGGGGANGGAALRRKREEDKYDD